MLQNIVTIGGDGFEKLFVPGSVLYAFDYISTTQYHINSVKSRLFGKKRRFSSSVLFGGSMFLAIIPIQNRRKKAGFRGRKLAAFA